MKLRVLIMLIALDIFIFALLTLGGSKRNETCSSAAWSTEQDGKWQGKVFRPFIDRIFYLLCSVSNHCQSSWINEQPALKAMP
jgi:hypothetical protein